MPGENFPFDDYGFSLIAVEVLPDNKIISVTSRWNTCSDDKGEFISESQLKEILGDKLKELYVKEENITKEYSQPKENH